MTTTPAGWYDDGQGAVRWWNGEAWTEHTTAETQPEPTSSRVGRAASALGRSLLSKEDPSTDPEAIWTAVGKPVTGIGGGRYKLTAEYLHFETGTISTKAQQIRTHEIYDVDANQTMTQKARGVGTIVLFARRTGSQYGERVELADIENFRDGVAVLNRISYEARERLRYESKHRPSTTAAFHQPKRRRQQTHNSI